MGAQLGADGPLLPLDERMADIWTCYYYRSNERLGLNFSDRPLERAAWSLGDALFAVLHHSSDAV